MSLIGSLFAGVTGLSSNSQAMEIIGDNIANVNTVGFKQSRGVFSDTFSNILSNGSSFSQVGRGATLNGVIQSFSQGSLEASPNALDLAIDGSGFFIVNNGNGNYYTRNGQLRMNQNGVVQAITGETLQGYEITNSVTSSSLTDVDLAGVQSAPVATTTFNLGANLNSSSSATTTFTSPVSMYNSVGTNVILSLTFTKQTGNTWNFAAAPSAGTVTSGASGSVTFGTAGQLSAVNGGSLTDLSIVIDYTSASVPADTQTLNWDLVNSSNATNGKLTGYAAASNNNSLTQDGHGTGTLLGLAVNSVGVINGLFNNGQSESLFQVALADFLAPSGLTRQGDNLFAESDTSGSATIGTANSGGFGSLEGSTLELSNVDLAEEFVTMIQTQQAFQASARIINTTVDLLTETVNLVR